MTPFARLFARWFPELHRFPSRREARRALWRASGRWQKGSRPPTILTLVFLLSVLVFFARGSFDWVTCVSAVLFGVAFALSWVWLRRDEIQRDLRGQLLDIGVPICLECGYDLRGQVEPRCPECGQPFEPLGDDARAVL